MGITNRDGALFMATGIDNSGLYSGLNQAEVRIDQFGNYVKRSGEKIGALVGVGFGAAGLKSFASEIINVRGEIQMLESSFEVLLGGKGVAGFMSELKQFSVDSPLSMNGVANAAQTLLGFGIAAENVMPIIKQIGDISMGNEEKFKSLSLAFAQMSSTGKLMGQDLLQMINAGFNPLSVISEKTGKSIGDLKKEMESGAISSQMVADAFASATAEGGQFYGMTQKQAEGIKGLQAQLEGGLQDAFNDLGKSQEGLITDGYKVAISLVENYEKVGKVLAILIATYGAYRAALVLNIALSKGYTVAQLAQYNALLMTERAQKLLNATILKNPYVMATTLIMGLVSSLVLFSNKASKAEKATAAFNAELKAEKEALDSSFSSLSKTKEGTDQRRRAIDEINTKYGGYLQNLINEKTTLEELKKAQEEATSALIYDRSVKMKEEYTNEHKEKQIRASKRFYENISNVTKKLTSEQKGQFQAVVEQMVKSSGDGFSILRKAMKEVGVSYDEMNSHKYYSGWAANDFDMAVKAMYRANNNMQKAENEAQEIVDSYLKTINPETPTTPDPVFQNITEEVEAAKNKVDELTKAIADLRSGKTSSENYKKDIEDKEKELKAAKEALKTLSGVSDKPTKDAELAAEKARKDSQKAIDAQLELINSEKKASFERRQARLDNEQALLDIEKDSADKRIRQIQLNYEKELLAIERYEQELIEAKQSAERRAWEASGSKGVFTPVAGNLGTEDQSIIDNRRSTNDKKLVTDQQEVLKSLLNQYQDYDAKRKAIEDKYSDDVAALTQMRTMENRDEINAAIAEAKRLKEDALGSINLEEMQDDINWDQVFGRMEESSTTALENLKNKLETYLSDAGSSISPENLNVLSNAIKQIDDALSVRNPFKNFIDGFKELKKAGKGTEEQYKALSKMQKGIEGASSFVSGIASDISSVTGDASKEVEDITNLVQSGFQAGQGAARVLAGDMTGLLDLAQGIAGLIGSIGSLFGGEDESVLRAIEQYKGMVSALDAVIDRQTKLLSMMTGEAATKQADVTKEMIRQQAEYEKEVLSNWLKSGKSWNHHSMAYRINRDQKDVLKDMGVSDINQVLKWSADQWDAFMRDHYASWAKLPEEVRNYGLAVINAEEQTTDLGKTLEEINTGVSFDSFKDGFVDTLMDLDSTAKDVAGNIEKYFQKAMLKSLIDTKYDKQIRALYDKFSKYNSIDGIDETEYADLQRAKEELARAITDERDAIMKTFGWESDSSLDNTLKGAYAKASQESIDLLAGQTGAARVATEAMRADTSSIRQSMDAIKEVHKNVIDKMEAIRVLTDEIKETNAQIAELSKDIKDNTGKTATSLNTIETQGIKVKTGSLGL